MDLEGEDEGFIGRLIFKILFLVLRQRVLEMAEFLFFKLFISYGIFDVFVLMGK